MKLRNKKTGEVGIATFKQYSKYEYLAHIRLHFGGKDYKFETIKKLTETFEDYAPAEPLIKDEKVRKAIKVWARLNKVKEVMFDEYWHSFRDVDMVISFLFTFRDFDCLEDGKRYTIAELCGEEEDRRLTWDTTRTSYCDKGLKEE